MLEVMNSAVCSRAIWIMVVTLLFCGNTRAASCEDFSDDVESPYWYALD